MQRLIIGWNMVTAVSVPSLILLGFIAGGFWYQYETNRTLKEELRAARAETASTTAQLDASIGILAEQINSLSGRATELADIIRENQSRLNNTESKLGGITGTVSTLEKLAKTDPELLQKYSKVFFLNENYTPSRLSEIDPQYLFNKNRVHQIHTAVLPRLVEMITEAAAAGHTLLVASAYRSFDEQHNIKNSYTITYGAGTANTFSADQGYSEHQLGTTVDFTTPELNGALSGFQHTDAYQWLLEHASRYGFILSYPPNNQYYLFEPWHWRFVGTRLARDLYLENKNFYDLDQRRIDEYLPIIFD